MTQSMWKEAVVTNLRYQPNAVCTPSERQIGSVTEQASTLGYREIYFEIDTGLDRITRITSNNITTAPIHTEHVGLAVKLWLCIPAEFGSNPDWGFRSIPQFLAANSRTVARLIQDRFPLNHFQFGIHTTSCLSILNKPETDHRQRLCDISH
jgi:hypothetical protein